MLMIESGKLLNDLNRFKYAFLPLLTPIEKDMEGCRHMDSKLEGTANCFQEGVDQ